MNMNKEEALRTLRGLASKTPFLRSQKCGSEEFEKWRHDVKAALKHIFKEEPEYVVEFQNIRYSLPIVFDQTSDEDFHDAYVDGLNSAHAMLQSRIDEINTYWQIDDQKRSASIKAELPTMPELVFVIHGRQKLTDFHNFLRAIGLKPLEWSAARRMTGKPTPYTWEIVDTALTQAGAIVALLTADDEARLREGLWGESENAIEKELLSQPRQNVLFEAGVAYGRAPQRTIIVRIGSHRPMSDLAGHHILVLNNSPESRQAVADALQAAGCPVDVSGADWFRAGDFSTE